MRQHNVCCVCTYELPEDDLNNDRNMLEHFKCFNINILD